MSIRVCFFDYMSSRERERNIIMISKNKFVNDTLLVKHRITPEGEKWKPR